MLDCLRFGVAERRREEELRHRRIDAVIQSLADEAEFALATRAPKGSGKLLVFLLPASKRRLVDASSSSTAGLARSIASEIEDYLSALLSELRGTTAGVVRFGIVVAGDPTAAILPSRILARVAVRSRCSADVVVRFVVFQLLLFRVDSGSEADIYISGVLLGVLGVVMIARPDAVDAVVETY